MGPIGRCLSAFCIADNKAVVFPPVSRIKEAKFKEQLLVQAVAAISLAVAQSLEAALDYLSSGFSGCNDGSSSSLESSNPVCVLNHSISEEYAARYLPMPDFHRRHD